MNIIQVSQKMHKWVIKQENTQRKGFNIQIVIRDLDKQKKLIKEKYMDKRKRVILNVKR